MKNMAPVRLGGSVDGRSDAVTIVSGEVQEVPPSIAASKAASKTSLAPPQSVSPSPAKKKGAVKIVTKKTTKSPTKKDKAVKETSKERSEKDKGEDVPKKKTNKAAKAKKSPEPVIEEWAKLEADNAEEDEEEEEEETVIPESILKTRE